MSNESKKIKEDIVESSLEGFLSKLQIIIVLYNMELSESDSFKSLIANNNISNDLHLYIYDNSKELQNIDDYKSIDIHYQHDPLNSGISKAYNEGAKYAKQKNRNWILILDQDTILPSNWAEVYYNSVLNNNEIKLFAPILLLDNNKIFSPCKYKMKRGFHLDEIEEGIQSLKEVSPVNSGMLILIEEFFNVGGYNEKVKLDFSDFQFIERFRENNDFFYVLDLICYQDFSNDNPSMKSQLKRYEYYCEGAYFFDKETIYERIQFLIIVFVRMLMLTFRYKTYKFGFIFIKNYLFK